RLASGVAAPDRRPIPAPQRTDRADDLRRGRRARGSARRRRQQRVDGVDGRPGAGRRPRTLLRPPDDVSQRRGHAGGARRRAGAWRDELHAVRDARTRPLAGYPLAWNAAVGISAGFFSFHMLANLRMAFMLVAAHAIIVAAVRVASAGAWGRLVDGCGARPVL